jgi:hypothetical protein
MTLRHRIPWIPMGFPGFPQDSKDSHGIPEIPRIPTGFPGFPQDSRDSRDSHRIPKIPRIPRIPMGFPWDSESRESAVSPLVIALESANPKMLRAFDLISVRT